MYYVIGSGPSGVACASALVAAGQKVTILDAGLTLETEREQRRLSMANRSADEWTEDEIRESRAGLDASGKLTAKLSHGSDYPYRVAPGGIAIDYGELAVRGSFARGGLSNVWGAAILPFRPEDTQGWPVSTSEMGNAHAEVMKLLPVAATRDNLIDLFPLPAERLQKTHHSRQIVRLIDALNHNRTRLARRGVLFGSARLAVKFIGNSADDSCNYCGHCLHGCPRDLIYSSRHTLKELLATGKLTYLPDVVVHRIAEEGHSAIVEASAKGEAVCFRGERVFLAAGVFNSTAILLRSLAWYDRPVDIADSQYYVFPLLQMFGTRYVTREPFHTLSQVFLEIADEAISPHLVHLQVYGYNDMLAEMLRHRLGRMWPYFPHDTLLGRLLLVQGFLHSAHSGRVRAVLKRHGSLDRLELQGVVNPETQDRVSRVMRRLGKLSLATRAVPVSPLIDITAPGRGFHCGGSFPMSRRPLAGQTDELGRPTGWSRLHVADATVFPSIPATTITQTIMANAYRIGAQSAHLEH